MSRYIYTVDDVVGDLRSERLPTTLRRTFLEQRALEELLPNAQCAAELGAGYGRMTQVLSSKCKEVWAFEREGHLRDIMRALLPDVIAPEVNSLSQLPIPAGYCDLVVTWTVLQHLHQDEVVGAVSEINRIAAPNATVILCEEVGTNSRQPVSKSQHVCISRQITDYQELIGANWELTKVVDRPKEATNGRPSTGSIMVFKRITDAA